MSGSDSESDSDSINSSEDKKDVANFEAVPVAGAAKIENQEPPEWVLSLDASF